MDRLADCRNQRIRILVRAHKQPTTPTATDLYGFGTKEWIAEFLAKPADGKFFGHMDHVK